MISEPNVKDLDSAMFKATVRHLEIKVKDVRAKCQRLGLRQRSTTRASKVKDLGAQCQGDGQCQRSRISEPNVKNLDSAMWGTELARGCKRVFNTEKQTSCKRKEQRLQEKTREEEKCKATGCGNGCWFCKSDR